MRTPKHLAHLEGCDESALEMVLFELLMLSEYYDYAADPVFDRV